MGVLGNVIFPAFQTAYFSWIWFYPIAVLAMVLEGMLLWRFNRDMSVGLALSCMLGANVVSYAAGLWITPHLFVESGLAVEYREGSETQHVEPEIQWVQLSRMSLLQAAILSAIIEGAVLLPFRRRLKIGRVVAPVVLGNCASYFVLFAVWAIQ